MAANGVALYLQDAHPIREAMEYVRYAEARGFAAVWQADSRLVRECSVPMAAFATVTDRIKIGSGVVDCWTRNPARLASTFSTLDDLAPGRMERGGAFRGRYHVLGGNLSALDGVGPEALRIPDLVARVAEEGTREVILALNATIDGQTTAHYIAGELRPLGVAVTSLAQGVPIGGELDYLDDGTIGAALSARRAI